MIYLLQGGERHGKNSESVHERSESSRASSGRVPFRLSRGIHREEGQRDRADAKETGWDDFFSRASVVPPDFMADREDSLPENRKLF